MTYKMENLDNPNNNIDKNFYNKKDGNSHWRAKVRELLDNPDYDDGVFFAFPKDKSTPPALVIGNKPQPPEQLDAFAQGIPTVFVGKSIGTGPVVNKEVFDSLSDKELSMVVQLLMSYMSMVADAFRNVFRNGLGDDYDGARQIRLGKCSVGKAEEVLSKRYGDSMGKFYHKISNEFDDFVDGVKNKKHDEHNDAEANFERIKKMFGGDK